MTNLYIKTFGCQMNEYDSQKITELLAKTNGLEITNNEDKADVFIVNTCSVREKAEEKLFHQLGRWKKYKKNNPKVKIAVGGCVASQEGAMILQRAPYVDVIFGPQTLHRLPHMLYGPDKDKTSIDISFPEIEKFDYLAKPKANKVSSYVSIMEGCSKYCSFCVVPYTRGEEISRPVQDVILEIQELVKQGVKEINLLGQNVNAYRGKLEDGEFADLAFLISCIAEIKEILRIRFTTSHPVEFNDRLINVYKDINKLVSHLHLPIQSGSDRILSLMKRGHTALEYKDKIRKLREIRPNISISSDFIIGYPSESEKDFKATLNLIDDIGFDKSFSFIYSKRPGTPAAFQEDNINLKDKKQRLYLLQEKLTDSMNKISKSMQGSMQNILVEGKSNYGGTLYGRTQNNRVTHFKGDSKLIGNMVTVKIIKVNANSLLAELI